MTPFRMRLFVVVFLAVATAIAANTMYMQQAPHAARGAVQHLSAAPDDRSAPATAAIRRRDPIGARLAAADQDQAAHRQMLSESTRPSRAPQRRPPQKGS